MAWGDEHAGFVSDPKRRPKEGEYNPADIQVRTTCNDYRVCMMVADKCRKYLLIILSWICRLAVEAIAASSQIVPQLGAVQ